METGGDERRSLFGVNCLQHEEFTALIGKDTLFLAYRSFLCRIEKRHEEHNQRLTRKAEDGSLLRL